MNVSATDTDLSRIDPHVLNSDFLQQTSEKPLHICCYGSSSSDTPERYMDAARSLGYILAKRGHTCVNGAGAFGCMAAMNDGAYIGDGHIVGVIHEMWLQKSDTLRDGGAHHIFQSTENAGSSNPVSSTASNIHDALSPSSINGVKREMLVAGGKDLQERKRLLVDKADALIVLPGGPGTWDELWEMVCARGIGISNIPIVCVNCDGYYDPFYEMLCRAYDEKLTKCIPHDLVHFAATAEDAVRWVEATNSGIVPSLSVEMKFTSKKSILRKSSIMHSPALSRSDTASLSNLTNIGKGSEYYRHIRTGIIFITGVLAGIAISSVNFKRKI